MENSKLEDMSKADLAKKFPITLYLLRNVQRNMETGPITDYKNFIGRAARYTGLHPKVLKELNESESISIVEQVDRSVIFNELITFYFDKNTIPTANQLFDALYKKIPPYITKQNFKKLLIKMGFMWKHIDKDLFVIIEKPLVTFQRYFYLKDQSKYKEKEDAVILYIDENAIDVYGNILTVKEAESLNKTDILQRYILAVSKADIHCVHKVTDINEETYFDWIENKLLPTLASPCVIVISNARHHCLGLAPPSLNSVKAEILEWLDYHNIPYEIAMSKYELFHLAENYTDLTLPHYKIDVILRSNGHTVLRIPDCIRNVTPSFLISKRISEILTDYMESKDSNFELSELPVLYEELLCTIPMEFLKHCFDITRTEEIRMYEVDMKVDSILDGLVEKMKSNIECDGSDSDVPSCSDSE